LNAACFSFRFKTALILPAFAMNSLVKSERPLGDLGAAIDQASSSARQLVRIEHSTREQVDAIVDKCPRLERKPTQSTDSAELAP
jgi:hypothetical protein